MAAGGAEERPLRVGELIRPAEERDAPDIGRIYNYYVVNATCTFQTEPDTIADTLNWLSEHAPTGPHPAFVYEYEGQVIGWASLSSYKGRCAYRYSAETSIYIEKSHHGKGVGSALLERLIKEAKTRGHHTLLAQIADGGASVTLHERFGFVEVGRLREVGFKFDRWIDVIVMQKML